MVALWCIIGLIVSATAVSTIGAAFSVFGLRDLFSGAAIAVCIMAASLELSKFVLAAYLHQRWADLNRLFKYYLVSSIVVLSIITSMGIFGFLSNAYQSASATLEAETLKLQSLQNQKARNESEIGRLTRGIDEIPANRITKKLQARAEAEPLISALIKENNTVAASIDEANLKILEVKQKVGPLIYISKAFNVDIDDVVKYLILIFVFVFDPLAICLVIATSEALDSRKNPKKAKAVLPAQEKSEPLPAAEHGGSDFIHMRFTDEEETPKKAE